MSSQVSHTILGTFTKWVFDVTVVVQASWASSRAEEVKQGVLLSFTSYPVRSHCTSLLLLVLHLFILFCFKVSKAATLPMCLQCAQEGLKLSRISMCCYNINNDSNNEYIPSLLLRQPFPQYIINKINSKVGCSLTHIALSNVWQVFYDLVHAVWC